MNATLEVRSFVQLLALREDADDLQTFVSRLRVPVLVAVAAVPRNGIGGYATHVITETAPPDAVAAGDDGRQPAVYEVVKRPEKPFPDMITVGRTAASDIRIAEATVSKFHAYFSDVTAAGPCKITDAGSRNGTFVGGERLEPRVPTPVPDGGEVAFAEFSYRFFTPGALYDFLETFACPWL